LVFKLGQTDEEPTIIASDFEGEPFIGITSMALSKNEKYLYITDSGSFAETSIQNPRGSLYEIDLEDQNQIRPIILKKMAFPTGLVVSQNGDLLYLCETLQNRILRVFIGEDGNFIASVFH
jgi:sugar lactone lactonase YvrE